MLVKEANNANALEAAIVNRTIYSIFIRALIDKLKNKRTIWFCRKPNKDKAMPARQIISILALSALIALPVGIAQAGDIDVNNGRSRVTIKNGSIRVRRGGRGNYVYPRSRSRRYRYYRGRLRRSPYSRLRNWRWRRNRYNNRYRLRRSYKKPSFSCNGKGTSYQRTIRNRSGGNRTYSSIRTSSCQR